MVFFFLPTHVSLYGSFLFGHLAFFLPFLAHEMESLCCPSCNHVLSLKAPPTISAYGKPWDGSSLPRAHSADCLQQSPASSCSSQLQHWLGPRGSWVWDFKMYSSRQKHKRFARISLWTVHVELNPVGWGRSGRGSSLLAPQCKEARPGRAGWPHTKIGSRRARGKATQIQGLGSDLVLGPLAGRPSAS